MCDWLVVCVRVCVCVCVQRVSREARQVARDVGVDRCSAVAAQYSAVRRAATARVHAPPPSPVPARPRRYQLMHRRSVAR